MLQTDLKLSPDEWWKLWKSPDTVMVTIYGILQLYLHQCNIQHFDIKIKNQDQDGNRKTFMFFILLLLSFTSTLIEEKIINRKDMYCLYTKIELMEKTSKKQYNDMTTTIKNLQNEISQYRRSDDFNNQNDQDTIDELTEQIAHSQQQLTDKQQEFEKYKAAMTRLFRTFKAKEKKLALTKKVLDTANKKIIQLTTALSGNGEESGKKLTLLSNEDNKNTEKMTQLWEDQLQAKHQCKQMEKKYEDMKNRYIERKNQNKKMEDKITELREQLFHTQDQL